MPVLMLNSPQVAGLIPRIQRHVALAILGTATAPAIEGEGYRSYQLPGTVRDILKNAGVDGYEAVPEQLELEVDGRLLDTNRGWDDWEPEPVPEAGSSMEPASEPVDLADSVFG